MGRTPARCITKFAMTCVEEPGAETPIFLPLSFAGSVSPPIVARFIAKTHCGARSCSTKAVMRWRLVCIIRVCSKAPETMSAEPPITACRDFEPPWKSTTFTLTPSSL